MVKLIWINCDKQQYEKKKSFRGEGDFILGVFLQELKNKDNI